MLGTKKYTLFILLGFLAFACYGQSFGSMVRKWFSVGVSSEVLQLINNKIAGSLKAKKIQFFFPNKIDLEELELQRLLGGEQLSSDLKIENGYVILSVKGRILGLGLLVEGRILSQIPRKELQFLTQKDSTSF